MRPDRWLSAKYRPQITWVQEHWASRPKPLKWVLSGITWLKSKVSARALAKAVNENKMAVAGLATAVTSAGIGSYATVNARQAQSGVDRVIEEQASAASLIGALQADLAAAQSTISALTDRADEGEVRNAAAFDALAARSRAVGRSMSALAGQVAALPSGDPQTAVLASRVAATAKAAQQAMAEAQKASAAAAQDHPDPQARAAAAQASQDARKAAQDAATAQASADAAQAGADRAERDTKYAPVVLSFPDGGPYFRMFTLPADGVYTVTLTGNGGTFFAGSTQGNTIARGTQNLSLSAGDSYFNAYSEGGTVTDVSVTFTLSRAAS